MINLEQELDDAISTLTEELASREEYPSSILSYPIATCDYLLHLAISTQRNYKHTGKGTNLAALRDKVRTLHELRIKFVKQQITAIFK